MPVIFDDEIAPPKGIVWDDETPASVALKQTRATLPLIPGDEVPPPEDQAILDQEERERQTEARYAPPVFEAPIQTVIPRSETNAPEPKPSITQGIQVPSDVLKAGIELVAPGTRLWSRTPMGQGAIESASEQLSGITSPESLKMLPVLATPVLGEGVGLGMAAQGLNEARKKFTEAWRTGDQKQMGAAILDAAGAATMIIPAAHGVMRRIVPKPAMPRPLPTEATPPPIPEGVMPPEIQVEPSTIGEPNALYSESQKILPNVRQPEVPPESEGALHGAEPSEKTGARVEPSPDTQAGEKVTPTAQAPPEKPLTELPADEILKNRLVREGEARIETTEQPAPVGKEGETLKPEQGAPSGFESANVDDFVQTLTETGSADGPAWGTAVKEKWDKAIQGSKEYSQLPPEQLEKGINESTVTVNKNNNSLTIHTEGYDDTRLATETVTMTMGEDGSLRMFSTSGKVPRLLKFSIEKAIDLIRGKVPIEKEPTRLTEAKPVGGESATAKEPWQMTRSEAVGEYREPFSVKQIQEAEKKAGSARARFNRRTGPMVPPAISGEISGKIGVQEANAAEMRDAYRRYVDDYKRRSEQHYEAVKQAIREGKPVPPEVLADYPDLAPATTPKGAIESQTAAQQPSVEKPFERARTTPAEGSPEREALDAEWSKWNARLTEKIEKLSELKAKIEKTGRFSKARESLDKRKEKLDEEYYALEKESKEVREQVRKAHQEDRLTSVNVIDAAKAASDLGDRNAYKTAEKLFLEESKRQGFGKDDATQMFHDAWAYTIPEEIGLPELVKRRGDRLKADQQSAAIRKEFESINPPVSGTAYQRFKYRMGEQYLGPEELQKRLDEYKAWVKETQGELDREEATKKQISEEKAQANAKELRPTSTERVTISDYGTSRLEKGRFLSNGRIMVESKAISPKFRKDLENRPTPTGTTLATQATAEKNIWTPNVTQATQSLEHLGYRKSPTGAELSYYHDPQTGNVWAIDHSYETLIKRWTGADSVKGTKNEKSPVTFFKGEDPVAIVMPFAKGEGVDIDVATLKPEPTAQRAQPEETGQIGQGPGAKTSTESTKPEQPESLEFTGLKHAIDELERIDYGFDKRPQQERQAMAEAWMRAGQTLLDNPLAGKELSDKLILNPKRGLTGDESALLLRHKRNLQESLNNAAEATITGTPEARAEARIIFENAEAELNQFMDAVAVRGSEWGREGRWRQAIAYEDYTFATQERLLRAAKNGERLTDAEHERLVKDVAEHKALLEAQQRRMAEQEQRHAKAIEDATKEAIDRIIARQPKIHPDILAAAEKIVVGFENRAAAASIRLREKLNRLGAAPDPTILVDLAEIGAGKLARKALDFAEWSKSMLDEFGEKITPYLQDAFDASKRLLTTDLVKVKGPKAEQIKRGADAATQQANTTAKIRNKVSEGKLGDISFEVHKLAKMFVERGIRNRDALIDAVHAVLKDIIPDITRRDTMDAISGYGRFERLSKDEISVQLRDLKGQMQQVAKLEDMAAREAPRKTGIERRSPSDEERRLIALVNEAKKKGGYEVTDPETQLVSAQMTRMTYLRNRIADLQHEIATKERIVKERREPPTNPEIEALKAEYKSLREERNKLFNTTLDSFKKRASKRIAELEAKSADLESKLKEGTLTPADIAPKPKRVPLDISKDTVAMELKAKLAEVENRIGKARYDARMALRTVPRRIWDAIKQTGSAFVNIKSSFDFSAPRQALVALLSLSTRPIAGWPKIAESFGRMFSAAFSEKRAHLIEQQIKNRPNAVSGLDKLAKIDYTSLDATNFTKYEDAAHSIFDEWAQLPLDTGNTAKTIATFVPKVFARGVRGSNRAFITFLNSIRASLADELFKFGFKDRPPTEVEAKDIGNLVNLATGRGNLNPMTAKLGASVLWSPNLLASRLKLLSAQPFWNPGSARTKALVASEYARVIGAGYLLWQVAQMFDTKKEKKWTSADHGKIVRGNTRIDLWGGFQQVTTLAARVAAGETTSEKGRTQDITKGKFGVPDLVYIGARFARSKLRPDIGLAVDILNRSDFIGRSTNIKTPEGRKNLKSEMIPIPLALDDVVSILKQHGFTEGMAIEALSQFGVGVSQHEAISRQR